LSAALAHEACLARSNPQSDDIERRRLIPDANVYSRMTTPLPLPAIRFTYDDLQQSSCHRQLFASPIEDTVTGIGRTFTPVISRPQAAPMYVIFHHICYIVRCIDCL
jgi:hypothetical protein